MPQAPAPTATLQNIEIVPPPAPAEPMVVALLPDDTVVPATPVPGPAPRAGATSIAAISRAAGTAAATVAEPAATPPEAGRNPMLVMRQPARPRLDQPRLSEGFTETFLDKSRPRAPNENPTEQLGEEIAELEGNLKNPGWIANATGEQIAMTRLDAAIKREQYANRELQPDGAGRKAEHEAFRVKVAADGSARFTDKPSVQRKAWWNYQLDITDGMMRKYGIDPYSSYKLKILDETRAERVAMGKRYRAQQLAQSPLHMQRNLERLWTSTADPAARKQGLFELWDDCAETGPDDLVAAGTAARAYIVGFIQSKLPAGSQDAYTTAEVARLNRQRKSQLPFAPY